VATTKRTTVVGVFPDRRDAERAIDSLKRHGFDDDQIGIAVRDSDNREGTIRSTGDDVGSGTAAGAVTGGAIGGILGALAAGLIPGVGPVIAGGVLAGVLGGAAAGAAAGGLIGALTEMDVPEDEARYYDEEFRGGRTIVTVRAGTHYDEARRILADHGAYDIENRGTTGTMPRTTVTDAGTAHATNRADLTDRDVAPSRRTGGDTLELKEEELVARKERASGKAEIEKDVVVERKAVDVPLTHEEAVVTRRPVDRRPTDQPLRDDEIEVELTRENVVPEKRTVVYEEVGLEKQAVRDTERIEADLGREVARVEGVDDRSAGRAHFASWDEAMPEYRRRWQERYGSSGGRWDDYEPGYRYSHEMANDPRFRDRDWNEVEPEFRSGYADWSRRSGYRSERNAWDKVRDNAREAWEEARMKMRGR
jgi:uncharacterized protein (TIGR02271 family)